MPSADNSQVPPPAPPSTPSIPEGAVVMSSEQLDAVVKRAAEDAAKEAGKAHEIRVKELEASLDAMRKKAVEDYKQAVLARNPDIIPELVTGSTHAEIDASLATAKAVFARVAAQTKQTPQPGVPGLPSPIAGAGAPPAPGGSDVQDLRHLPVKEFAQEWGKIRRKQMELARSRNALPS